MSDLLAVVKSRLSRPKKPLISMLFIGPTGVGKTELAKALAEFLFNDRNRLIRFDMSEFASPAGAIRLISGARDSEGLLTTKVREHPFSVILLDEFEKAHPDVFDLFLQVFGEGRLTDARGRVADFCNTVIIMTSNLGVESFKKQTTGFAQNANIQNQAREHFTSTVRKFLRPEMFNRIDAIVPFSPLDLETVQQIAKREIDHVLRRDGIQMRNLEICLDDDVTGYLARKGFDPKYGARPLKRTIEEQLISPLAHRLNTYPESEELAAFVKVQNKGLCIDVSRKSPEGDPQKPTAAEIRVKNIVNQCVSLRQDFQILKKRPEMMEIVNQMYRLKRVPKRSLKKPGTNKAEEVRSKRLSDLQHVRNTFTDLEHQANMLEFDLLINIYEKKPFDEKDIEHQLSMIRQDLRRLLISIYRLKFQDPQDPDYVTLAVFGEDPETLFDLAHAYFAVAKKYTGSKITVFSLRGGYSTKEGKRTVLREEIKKPEDFLLQPVKGIVGVLFGISADTVLPKLMPEHGWHEFKKKKKTYKCFVHTSSQAHGKYKVPEGADKPGGIQSKEKRRTYSYVPMEVFDAGINKKFFWQGAVDTILNTAVEQYFEKEIQSLLDA
jgi:DNA polymerase III delta prime subunit